MARPRLRHGMMVAFGLAAAIVLLELLAAVPVAAGGRRPVLPGGSSLQPREPTEIQLAEEVVTLSVRPAALADNTLVGLNPESYFFDPSKPWFTAIVEVEADFRLKNPTQETIRVEAQFPLASALETLTWKLNPGERVPRIERFQAWVDGEPLEHTVEEQSNPSAAGSLPLPWAVFPLSIPGQGETLVHLSYSLAAQEAGGGMFLYYIFQTGGGWAGTVGKTELVIELPYPASAETLAGVTPASLQLPPYYTLSERSELPAGARLEGNQARWTWAAREPGPGEFCALILLTPGSWQVLETARAAVLANPQDGRAWLDLGAIYLTLAGTRHYSLSLFAPVYLPLSRAAFEQAVRYLPEHPGSHAGLALMSLMPYLPGRDAPPETIALVEKEYEIAKRLEAQNPVLAAEQPVIRSLLDMAQDVIFTYFDYYWATSEAEWATQTAAPAAATAFWAEKTRATTALGTAPATVILTPTLGASATLAPTSTVSPTLSATPTPLPSPTMTPVFTPTLPTPVRLSGEGVAPSSLGIAAAAGVLVLLLLVSLAIRKTG